MHARLAGVAVDHDGVVHELTATAMARRDDLLAAQHRPHPCQQLLEGEGLDQVVVRAGVQSATRSATLSRAVSIRMGTALRPRSSVRHFDAVDVRQHQVEDDQVRACSPFIARPSAALPSRTSCTS